MQRINLVLPISPIIFCFKSKHMGRCKIVCLLCWSFAQFQRYFLFSFFIEIILILLALWVDFLLPACKHHTFIRLNELFFSVFLYYYCNKKWKCRTLQINASTYFTSLPRVMKWMLWHCSLLKNNPQYAISSNFWKYAWERFCHIYEFEILFKKQTGLLVFLKNKLYALFYVSSIICKETYKIFCRLKWFGNFILCFDRVLDILYW